MENLQAPHALVVGPVLLLWDGIPAVCGMNEGREMGVVWHHESMKLPHMGQRVWADGLIGTFTVVRLDEDHGVANLELTTDTRVIEQHIPFDTIHPLGDGENSERRFGRD